MATKTRCECKSHSKNLKMNELKLFFKAEETIKEFLVKEYGKK